MNTEMSFRNRQSGAALIVALIFLLMMSLISTAAMRTSMMQERMAGSMRDWNLGFQSAEASLREAEEFLRDTAALPEFTDTAGLYQVNSVDLPVWVGKTTSNGNGYITYSEDIAEVPTRPRYYIEKLTSVQPAGSNTETGTPIEELYFFRVTALGFGAAVDNGGTPLTNVVLNSVYRSR